MENNNRRLTSAFIAVTTLFFAWGFITSMIDPLIPVVRAVFKLTTTESMLTQFFYFLAYGVFSLPAAALVSKIGYSRSILYALVIIIVGCLFIPVATGLDRLGLVLCGLFIIASGVTILQVAANPLAAALGNPEKSHFRLTFSQAFNSLGTVIGPYVGAVLMLQGGVFGADDGVAISPEMRAVSLRNIDTSFLAFAAALVVLTIFLWRSRQLITDTAPVPARSGDSVASALRSPWAILGAVAIFLYVGAEVSIGSNLNFLLQRKDVLGLTAYEAGKVVPYYWGGAMVGRFVGSALLTRIKAARLLTVFAAVNAVLCLTVWLTNGYVAAGAALVAGLFNSIMFPTIFTITLERSTASAAATSGLLCVAIIGGALLPLMTGFIADKADMHVAFLVPLVAYLLISLFASAASKARVVTVGAPAEGAAH